MIPQDNDPSLANVFERTHRQIKTSLNKEYMSGCHVDTTVSDMDDKSHMYINTLLCIFRKKNNLQVHSVASQTLWIFLQF